MKRFSRGEPAWSGARLAAGRAAWTIAFPCISTGAFGYPKDEACRIATDAVLRWLARNEYPRQVTFCCYDAEDAALYRERLRDLGDPA